MCKDLITIFLYNFEINTDEPNPIRLRPNNITMPLPMPNVPKAYQSSECLLRFIKKYI